MYPEYSYYSYTNDCFNIPVTFPPQHQDIQPGMEYLMNPKPIFDNPYYIPSGKLKGKVAIITGGDSGIGRAVSLLFAKEGAFVIIVYLNEEKDAKHTEAIIHSYGGKCMLIQKDIRNEKNCADIVNEVINKIGKIDILVNNAAVQFVQENILDISEEQLKDTFETNVFSYFYLTKAVLPHLKENSCIINTTSITAFNGKKNLIDYSASKGAVTVFTKSLSLSLVDKKIRVNAVAPGPIWTPLTPASFSAEEVARFGLDVPMRRAGQPFELAPTYLYLACDDSRYVTGQVLHVNGGSIV